MGRRPYAAVLVAVGGGGGGGTGRVRGRRRHRPSPQRADRRDRVDTLRPGRMRVALGTARLPAPERHADHPRAGAPARQRHGDRRAVHESRWSRRIRCRLRARSRRRVSRGILDVVRHRVVGPARGRRERAGALHAAISTRSTRSTATRPPCPGSRRTSAASHAFVDACEREQRRILPYVSTAATVRDMDAIRAAIGLEQINYLGFSYGT